jgi:diaminopimelate epimerase
MTSSTWRALGNAYVVVEPGEAPLDASSVADLAHGADGVLEVLAVSKDRVEIAIWNPDGSQAELSGNGTRIAAAWLAARSGADRIEVVVGERTVVARMLGDGTVEQEMGEVVVGQEETIDGLAVRSVSVGNPHAVVLGDPDTITEIGPYHEAHARFPNRTNVQVARIDGPGEVTARVWERGVGETASSGWCAVAVAAATLVVGDVLVHFPGGDLRVRLHAGVALLYGSAERVS